MTKTDKMELWNNEYEIEFFQKSLEGYLSPEQIFYNLPDGKYAYIPKGLNAEGRALQSRNSLIGSFTEKYCRNLFAPIAKEMGLFALNGVVCDEIGLSNSSSADLAFCTSDDRDQTPDGIKIIFEIKMSIVSNYKYSSNNDIRYIGDYSTHKGTPSILRSDSMLKAIGKAINIRVSGDASAKIPIVIIGNSPIMDSYLSKVDHLKESGVIQQFISLNPHPLNGEFLSSSDEGGFKTISHIEELKMLCCKLIYDNMFFFSSMKNKNELGKIILKASKEKTHEARAEIFLLLLRQKK